MPGIRLNPEILVFDVDGVLVDVRQTYWRAALETVRALSGKQVTYAELHEWKAKPGNNDDWQMTAAWLTALGRPTTYAEARREFEKFYWGTKSKPGLVRHEKLLVRSARIARWAATYELNLFTGRTRREFAHTFERWPATKHFRRVITMDDASRKPDPEGLFMILDGRDPRSALYVGDNIDDALAAREAGVPFVGITVNHLPGTRERARRFRELGAVGLLAKAGDLDRLLGTSNPKTSRKRPAIL
jgi:HAD superfamily phosphatase